MKIIPYYHCTLDDVKRNLATGITRVDGYMKDSAELHFYCKNGSVVVFYHEQDCCESVWLEDSDGLVSGFDIFTDCDWCEVEEITENRGKLEEWDESFTWTFYKFRTNKGYDTVRWYGTSNGYYSESVDFKILEK